MYQMVAGEFARDARQSGIGLGAALFLAASAIIASAIVITTVLPTPGELLGGDKGGGLLGGLF